MRDGDRWKYPGNVVIRTKSVFTLPDRIKESGAKVFVSSLTDWLHPEIDSYRSEMWEIMRRNPHLIYQLLTKRWQRLENHLPNWWFARGPWPNVWLGISAGNQQRYNEAMEYFKRVDAAIKWVSLEPLTGPIHDLKLKENGIQWVVVGGESGNDNGKWRYRPCDIFWIGQIVRQCKEAGVPVFVKQLGTHLAKALKLQDRTGGTISEWKPGLINYKLNNPERVFSEEDVDWLLKSSEAELREFPTVQPIEV